MIRAAWDSGFILVTSCLIVVAVAAFDWLRQ